MISVLGKTESELIDSVLVDDLDEVSEWIKWTSKYINQLGIEQSWSLEEAQEQERGEQAQLQTKRGADAELLKNILKMKSNKLEQDQLSADQNDEQAGKLVKVKPAQIA
ncbi:hypothetical protein F511_30387 [Dorcoceras hygrometricum]|uniref:Uncharacterized protein n=1 Tax=Dorcoceras hygrometricum TaxID=472368 RepID=A0A2Z7CFY1_9LAMI|nr:hypothetical protein F511_30387 [Dorcoceras hygrometricum]